MLGRVRQLFQRSRETGRLSYESQAGPGKVCKNDCRCVLPYAILVSRNARLIVCRGEYFEPFTEKLFLHLSVRSQEKRQVTRPPVNVAVRHAHSPSTSPSRASSRPGYISNKLEAPIFCCMQPGNATRSRLAQARCSVCPTSVLCQATMRARMACQAPALTRLDGITPKITTRGACYDQSFITACLSV